MVLIFIFLITKAVHLFTCLFVIYISSLMQCLFMFFFKLVVGFIIVKLWEFFIYSGYGFFAT